MAWLKIQKEFWAWGLWWSCPHCVGELVCTVLPFQKVSLQSLRYLGFRIFVSWLVTDSEHTCFTLQTSVRDTPSLWFPPSEEVCGPFPCPASVYRPTFPSLLSSLPFPSPRACLSRRGLCYPLPSLRGPHCWDESGIVPSSSCRSTESLRTSDGCSFYFWHTLVYVRALWLAPCKGFYMCTQFSFDTC